jgi:hypothetical protein
MVRATVEFTMVGVSPPAAWKPMITPRLWTKTVELSVIFSLVSIVSISTSNGAPAQFLGIVYNQPDEQG